MTPNICIANVNADTNHNPATMYQSHIELSENTVCGDPIAFDRQSAPTSKQAIMPVKFMA